MYESMRVSRMLYCSGLLSLQDLIYLFFILVGTAVLLLRGFSVRGKGRARRTNVKNKTPDACFTLARLDAPQQGRPAATLWWSSYATIGCIEIFFLNGYHNFREAQSGMLSFFSAWWVGGRPWRIHDVPVDGMGSFDVL